MLVFKDTPRFRDIFKDILESSIKEVSVEFKLRRELGCDVQFSDRYSEVH